MSRLLVPATVLGLAGTLVTASALAAPVRPPATTRPAAGRPPAARPPAGPGTSAGGKVDAKGGPIKFGGLTAKPVPLAMGDRVKLEAELKVIDVGKIMAVQVRGDVVNTADVKMHYSYQVALLDADRNLIGCQNFTLFLDPGKKAAAGTFISLPPEQIEKIAFYSAVFYESEQDIGTK